MSKAKQISDSDDRAIWHELRTTNAVTHVDLTNEWRLKRDPRTLRKVRKALRERIQRLQELLERWEAK